VGLGLFNNSIPLLSVLDLRPPTNNSSLNLRSNEFCYGVQSLAAHPTPNLEGQVISLCLGALLRPVRQGWPYQ
jgi:hypothetical protein